MEDLSNDAHQSDHNPNKNFDQIHAKELVSMIVYPWRKYSKLKRAFVQERKPLMWERLKHTKRFDWVDQTKVISFFHLYIFDIQGQYWPIQGWYYLWPLNDILVLKPVTLCLWPDVKILTQKQIPAEKGRRDVVKIFDYVQIIPGSPHHRRQIPARVCKKKTSPIPTWAWKAACDSYHVHRGL